LMEARLLAAPAGVDTGAVADSNAADALKGPACSLPEFAAPLIDSAESV